MSTRLAHPRLTSVIASTATPTANLLRRRMPITTQEPSVSLRRYDTHSSAAVRVHATRYFGSGRDAFPS